MKVCVYAICKNEKKFVDQWIKSMSEADYICILDTGSDDGTYDLLQSYAEKSSGQIILAQKVIKPWRFDVARNESMKLIPSDADICICTDLDEILVEGWSKYLKESWDTNINRLYYLYAWSHRDDGEPARIFWYDKCHSNDGKWHWDYPVHETLKYDGEMKGRRINFNEVLLHHYPDNTKSRGNYLPLLEQRAQENPQDYYGLVYLAHEYYYRGHYLECLNFINKILPQIPLDDMMYCETDLYMFKGDCHIALGQRFEAEQCYKYGIAVTPEFRDNYIQLAKLYQYQKRYQESINIINEAFAKSRRLYSWLERDHSWTCEPQDLLCVAYYNIGAKHTALMYARMAYESNPTDERLKNNVISIQDELKVE